MTEIQGNNQFRLNDEILLFTKEVEENLMDHFGDKYGTIILKRNVIDVRYGMGYEVLPIY